AFVDCRTAACRPVAMTFFAPRYFATCTANGRMRRLRHLLVRFRRPQTWRVPSKPPMTTYREWRLRRPLCRRGRQAHRCTVMTAPPPFPPCCHKELVEGKSVCGGHRQGVRRRLCLPQSGNRLTNCSEFPKLAPSPPG